VGPIQCGVREQCEGASERGSVHILLHATYTRVRSKREVRSFALVLCVYPLACLPSWARVPSTNKQHHLSLGKRPAQ
jgi:hypothetical protein